MSTMLEPIDEVHRECLWARDNLRRQFTLLKYHASMWTPKPPPPRKEYQ